MFDPEKREKEITSLEIKISSPDFWKNSKEAQNIISQLNILKKPLENWKNLKKQLEETSFLVQIATEADPQSINEVKNNLLNLKKNAKSLEIQIKLPEKYDASNAIVSLHSGAGGVEACDWCQMLFRMYIRWTEKKDFKVQIVDILEGEEAGIKNVTFFVKGLYAYGLLKSEIGVHRLVRISPFDANKRRHTSFASCDVLPEVEEEEVKINESELKIETFRASGHGGQHLQKTESAVRITHIPTGIVAQCQDERSQYQNKMTALKILKAKLYDFLEAKKRVELEKKYKEKGDIAWGHQIRSYIFMPYRLVKDHRTEFETSDVDGVLNGEIDDFIESYLSLPR